jgi:hypothetical protein
MSSLELALTHVCSGIIIAVMLALCLRSKNPEATLASGRRIYRIHPGWYWFCALGGAFLVGIFAFASTITIPENKKSAAIASVISAAFFVFFAAVLRAASVTIDETSVTARTLFGERTETIAQIESVKVVGLVVEIKFRADAASGRTPKALNFLAGLRGLGELLATLRARAGLPAET